MKDLKGISEGTTCCICSKPSKLLYDQVPDYTFGVPGEWDYVQCIDEKCRTIQISPFPDSETIKSFYQSYYTQQSTEKSTKKKGEGASTKPPAKTYKQYLKYFLSKLIFWRADQFLNDLRYLGYRKSPGRLLDVGCGSGDFLKEARDYGWAVSGCDNDEKAAEVANSIHNLNVQVGDLESIHYAEKSFDAVTLNNVIEHLINPLATMEEAYRVLNDGGRFVSISPNPSSFLHQRYKKYWRGLESPRHLVLLHHFTLRQLAKRAGFKKVFSFTSQEGSGVKYVEIASQKIVEKAGEQNMNTSSLSAVTLKMLMLRSLLGASTGEFCVVIADK